VYILAEIPDRTKSKELFSGIIKLQLKIGQIFPTFQESIYATVARTYQDLFDQFDSHITKIDNELLINLVFFVEIIVKSKELFSLLRFSS